MRVDQLRYLSAVTRHGSLRRASEHLHLSQQALGEALARLEAELGVTLLDRRRSGARVSPQGLDLLPLMEEVVDAAERLRAAAGRGAQEASVRIGTVSTATSTLLVPAVRSLGERGPAVGVEVVQAQVPAVEEGLREGTLELGLVNGFGSDPVPAGLTATPLLRGRPVVVLPAGHPLAAYDAVPVAALADQPFVAMREGYVMRRLLHRLFPDGLPPVPFSTDGADLAKLLVAEGLGVTLLPDYSVADDPLLTHGLLEHRPLAHDATRVTLSLWQRPGGRPRAATTAVVRALVAAGAERARP